MSDRHVVQYFQLRSFGFPKNVKMRLFDELGARISGKQSARVQY
jgi:hypothetical protein